MRNGLKQLTAQPHASFLSGSGEFVSDDIVIVFTPKFTRVLSKQYLTNSEY